MPLAAGTRLGPYEILAPLGAGGMGEVYRAKDTKLGRDVAIKILPEAFAADPERLARFQREAQVLASLNHPHIAHIHGLEESGRVRGLVLELVEGETLAERIAQGPVPVDEALEIARQIADALEAAHEKGIVHRDLKPANVKHTPAGSVKVLDFGLAKALKPDSSSPEVTSSPTMTAQSTQAGIVIGTAAYMSPEQARGKAVDKRTDVWAFGAVLFEMLTGKKTFGGETVSDTLAAVLKTDPDWGALPPKHPRVRRLLRRCLERDPKKRLHDIADARIEMEERPEEAREPVAPSRSARPWLVALARAFRSRSRGVRDLEDRLAARSRLRPGGHEGRAPHAGRGALRMAELVSGRQSPRIRLQPHRKLRDLFAAGRGRPGRRHHERSHGRCSAGVLAGRRLGRLHLDAVLQDRPHTDRRHVRAQRADVWRRSLGHAGARRSGEADGPGRELPVVAARRIRHPLRHGPGEPPRDHGGAFEGRPAAGGLPERGVGLRALPDRVLPEREVDQSRDAAGRPSVDAGSAGGSRARFSRASVTRGMSRRAACTSSSRTPRAAAAFNSSRRATILSPPSRARSAS